MKKAIKNSISSTILLTILVFSLAAYVAPLVFLAVLSSFCITYFTMWLGGNHYLDFLLWFSPTVGLLLGTLPTSHWQEGSTQNISGHSRIL